MRLLQNKATIDFPKSLLQMLLHIDLSYSKKEENYFQILILFYEIIAKQINN
jgi:hypothetical protein